MNWLIGDRINQAIIDSWNKDGSDGKLCAATTVIAVVTAVIGGILSLIKLFN